MPGMGRSTQPPELDVLVVGAGLSGLATTAALRRYGVSRVRLIERGSCYGAFWADTYDRVALHSPWHGLPDDGGLNDEYGIFKSRLELIDYLTRYAERHLLGDVTAFGESLQCLRRITEAPEPVWHAETSRDDYLARQVVIATGYCRTPRMPTIRGADSFEPLLLHSADYRNGVPYRGKRVLVAGSGNSAFEIATDLVEHGAAAVTLLVHTPRWVVPIDSFADAMHQARACGAYGVDVITEAHSSMPGSPEYAAWIRGFDELLRNLAIDVSDIGITTPTYEPWGSAIATGRVGVFDRGAVPLMRAGAIEVVNDRIASFGSETVEFSTEGHRAFEAVIMATGFEPGLGGFLDDAVLRFDEPHRARYPATDGRCRSTVRQGLYFVGFDMSPWGGMAHGHWGFEVAEKIATTLGTFTEDLRPAEFKHSPWSS